LKRWLDLNNVTSVDLGKETGINDSTIRHLYRTRVASVEMYKKISKATGIPLAVLVEPAKYVGFDIGGCRANNIDASVGC